MTSYSVRIDLPLTLDARERSSAVAGRLYDNLAAQYDEAVQDAEVASEFRRGTRLVWVRVTMTAEALDPGGALVAGLKVLRQAIGTDARSWDLSGTSATVAPVPGQ